MWSRKICHIFAQLSVEVIRGNCGETGEYATFPALEPFECSSTQTRRPTNWATPGYGWYYTRRHRKKQSQFAAQWGISSVMGVRIFGYLSKLPFDDLTESFASSSFQKPAMCKAFWTFRGKISWSNHQRGVLEDHHLFVVLFEMRIAAATLSAVEGVGIAYGGDPIFWLRCAGFRMTQWVAAVR